MIELLSPVGDFDCLKAAVQNGADAVYFGANLFSARAFASNFDDTALEQAINYAKIRGVKTNLTLNTLIKNNEIADAINLAKKAYQLGVDAIIVQDLGLARYLIKNFPGLKVHGSTQMSVHNLDGTLELEELGFSRVVLSRELNISEIQNICKNSNIEIECFVHGALCISYSGQCLFSSMVGGRSGNRGKCAQPCRMQYELLENNTSIDKGFLLSPRDLCGLDFLPQLVSAGVSCLKIEGRMKTPEYVATVTRIYRKYLDLAISNKEYEIDPKDKQDLLQVFNRGGFSDGHLKKEPNLNLIYKNKSNNMGLYLGKISNYNSNKGHITFIANTTLCVGDKINVENRKHETSTYTVSELMKNDKNIKQAIEGDKIKIGRMKGDISIGDKLYKVSDKALTTSALNTIDKENRKRNLTCYIKIKSNQPVSINISDNDGINLNTVSDIIPVTAINAPITKERIISQFSKTNNTPYCFDKFEIDLDDNLYIQSISSLNELRRNILEQYENKLISSFKRTCNKLDDYSSNSQIQNNKKEISLLLNIVNTNFDYSKLKNVDKLYIPFKYFIFKEYNKTIENLCNQFNTYIYLPTISREHYHKLITKNLDELLNTYKIKGFVLSNIGDFNLLKDYTNYEFICNYTFNVYNDMTISKLNSDCVTLSPELSQQDISSFNSNKKKELIVYGNTPLMNSNYCLLGCSNRCYQSCTKKCQTHNKYYLKDRLGLLFRIIPDNIETVTTIYNSKTTSITTSGLTVDSFRIDILDENVEEINNIIRTVQSGNKLEGKNFTNGNFNKDI